MAASDSPIAMYDMATAICFQANFIQSSLSHLAAQTEWADSSRAKRMFGINVTLYASVLSRWNSPNETYSQKQRGPIGQRTAAALATDNSGNKNEATSPLGRSLRRPCCCGLFRNGRRANKSNFPPLDVQPLLRGLVICAPLNVALIRVVYR